MLCIIWGYFWFAEFMLIWYGNIPEETSYFITRMQTEEWRLYFFANIIINWFIPFAIMMPAASRRSKITLKIIIPVLLMGLYIDLYLQIFPGVVGQKVRDSVRKTAEWKGIDILESHLSIDRIYLVLSFRPKYACSDMFGTLNGCVAIRLFKHLVGICTRSVDSRLEANS